MKFVQILDSSQTHHKSSISSDYWEFLVGVPIFSSLTDEEEKIDILQAIQECTLECGDILFQKGELGDAAYIIKKGVIQIYTHKLDGEQVQIATLGVGDILGELALLDGTERSATARASETTCLLRIDRDQFELLRRNMKSAAYKLVRAILVNICDRIRSTNEYICHLLIVTDEKAKPTDSNVLR
ncbi:MAG: cyclic nucleotide-binding domain-containing protein [Microcoleus sp.]